MDNTLEESSAKEILKVIGDYSKALDLLDNYDYKEFKVPKGHKSDIHIKYEDCISIIEKLKFK